MLLTDYFISNKNLKNEDKKEISLLYQKLNDLLDKEIKIIQNNNLEQFNEDNDEQ